MLGIERIPNLVFWGKSNIEKANPELIQNGIVKLVKGNGMSSFHLFFLQKIFEKVKK